MARGENMKERIRTLTSVCLAFAFIGVPFFAGDATAKGKPGPDPAPTEPTGDFASSSDPQALMATGGYARVYTWVDGEFNHGWSGITDYNTWTVNVIGDIDNDGYNEVLTAGSHSTTTGTGKNKVTTTTRTWFLWQDGDASDSASLSFDPGFVPGFMEIGDANNDGYNELVMAGTTVRVWSWNGNGFDEDAKILNVGSGGLTIADADNDDGNEILVGMARNSDGTSSGAAVMKYANGAYSVVARLGPTSGCPIDDVSVGDLDGDGNNELFGSGYNGARVASKIFIWKYSADSGGYSEIWNGDETEGEFHQSNEIADINGDGVNEIAFGELNNKHLVIYKYDGDNLWSLLGKYDNCAASNMDQLFSGDFDGDGTYSLLAADQVWDWTGSAMEITQDLISGGSSSGVSLA